jgi:hypothetical protein
MKKWLRWPCLAIAVVLAAVQIVAWAASYRWLNLAVLHSWARSGSRRQFEHVTVNSDRGVWRVYRFRATGLEGAVWGRSIGPVTLSKPFDRRLYGSPDMPTWRELILPEFRRTTSLDGRPGWYLGLPSLWTVMLTLSPILFHLAPAIRRWRGRARARRGLCSDCGYDLRGSPERCPECGMPAPP